MQFQRFTHTAKSVITHSRLVVCQLSNRVGNQVVLCSFAELDSSKQDKLLRARAFNPVDVECDNENTIELLFSRVT